MRALGEILLSNLHYKSFIDMAHDLIGPGAGYHIGWSYWSGLGPWSVSRTWQPLLTISAFWLPPDMAFTPMWAGFNQCRLCAVCPWG